MEGPELMKISFQNFLIFNDNSKYKLQDKNNKMRIRMKNNNKMTI